MKILSLGCGSKTSTHPDVLNIDWSVLLRLKKNRLFKSLAPLILSNKRLERLNSLHDNIIVHDIAKVIPFPDNSVDVVYHSHMLEHLDRNVAELFLIEMRRVLKDGGVARIVVPDFEYLCQAYFDHCKLCDLNRDEDVQHEKFIAAMLEQSVRRESYGTSQQTQYLRFVENIILGDARKRGETHQWMYDRISLKALCLSVGFDEVKVQSFDSSLVPNWGSYGLDLDGEGGQYKPHSLYFDAVK